MKDAIGLFDPEECPLEDEIKISLTTFKLSDCPSYVALSYTWGLPGTSADPEPSVFTNVERIYPIFCEGGILLCTWNLRSALRRIRFAADVNRSVDGIKHEKAQNLKGIWTDMSYFWIDALCIDQDNLSERLHQVRSMSQIYKQARKILVWLGEDDKFGKDAYAAMEKANDEIMRFWFRERPNVLSKKLPYVTLEPPEIPACVALLSRKWFSRFWVRNSFSGSL